VTHDHIKNLTARIKCPFCQTMGKFVPEQENMRDYDASLSSSLYVSGVVRNREGLWWIGICPHCDAAVLILGSGQRIIPAPKMSDQRIPAAHRKYLDEARACLHAGAANGAVTVAGKALDSFIKSLTNAPQTGTLGVLLDWCAKNNKLPDELIGMARTTKAVRNDGAHHNDNDPTVHEAELTIEIIEFILTFYFGQMQAATALKLTHPK
jgi:hypothetical protein